MKKSAYSVAIVGATGLVGETLLQVLEERNFPVGEVHALASSRSLGKAVEFKGRSLHVQDLGCFSIPSLQGEPTSPSLYSARKFKSNGLSIRL